MADNKKYYYLKLKENFFDSEEMILLETQPNGYLYSNILLKLYLRSLKNEGKLMFKDRIPYNMQMLSKVVGHNIDVVEKAMFLFKELGLVEVLDNGAIYMMDIQNFIGKSSNEADRIRNYRNRINQDKKVIETKDSTNVVQMYNKSTPEIELEIELEIEKDNNSVVDKFNPLHFFEKFWSLYPRKVNKKKAQEKFIKICKDEDTYNEIIKGLDKYKKSKQWQTVEYIPHAVTWLNGERWKDEIEVVQNEKSEYSVDGNGIKRDRFGNRIAS